MGMALSSCTVPASGVPTFEIGDNEMEVGIGIHGEPGRGRKLMSTADEITELLALSILEDPAYTRKIRLWDGGKGQWHEVEQTDEPLRRGDQILALVNGMGGTPLSELYIVYRKLCDLCKRKGMHIVRSLIGNYITSLEMQGCSITLLRTDEELVDLWDAPVHTPSLRWGV